METGFDMSKSSEVGLIGTISEAFAHRAKPDIKTNSDQLSPSEAASLEEIFEHRWQDLSADIWEENFDAVSWLAPQAFCYYLPGILISSILHGNPNLIAATAIIGTLDRSPTPAWWDDFFVPRWTSLTLQECNAVQEWLLWVCQCETRSVSDDSIGRSLDTLELLKARIT